MTASELQDLLVNALVRRWGGSKREWRAAVGRITVHDRSTHAHCNWSVAPRGEADEVAAVEQLLDQVRIEHPFVAKG